MKKGNNFKVNYCLNNNEAYTANVRINECGFFKGMACRIDDYNKYHMRYITGYINEQGLEFYQLSNEIDCDIPVVKRSYNILTYGKKLWIEIKDEMTNKKSYISFLPVSSTEMSEQKKSDIEYFDNLMTTFISQTSATNKRVIQTLENQMKECQKLLSKS